MKSLGPFALVLLIVPFIVDTSLSDRYFISRMLVVAVGMLASFIFIKDIKKLQGLNLLDSVLVIFIIWHWVSMCWAINFSEALTNNLRFTLGGSVYFFWRYLVSSSKFNLDQLTGLIHLVALIYAIVAWIGIINIGIEFGLSNKDLYRLQFPGGHKSIIAEFALLTLPFVLTDSHFKKLKWVSIPLLIGSIFILQSRAAFLGLLVLLVVGLWMYLKESHRQTKKSYLLLGLVAVVCTFFVFRNRPIGERLNMFNYLNSQTAQERIVTWDKTFDIIRDNPLIGVGSGNWKIHFPSTGLDKQWVLENRDIIFTRVHNDYLEIAAETGIIGLLVWIFILFLGFYYALSMRNEKPKQLILLFLTTYLSISFFDFPKERIEICLLFWTVLGLCNIHSLRTIIKLSIPWIALVIINLFVLGLIVPKYYGEKQLVKALDARAQQEWNNLTSFADRGENTFYSMDPYAMPLSWYQGLGYYQSGNIDAAHQQFLRAYKKHPWQYHVLNNLATTYFNLNQMDSALVYYNQCLEVNPHFTDVYFNKSVVLTRLNRFEEARECLSTLTEPKEKLNSFKIEIDRLEQGFLKNE